jgi:RNA polymerase sigma-70 factor (ECF subfamily)
MLEEHLRLVRLAFAVSGDMGLAEDCAQEVLVRAWERVNRGTSPDSLSAWTTTVALNWCRSQLRRRGAESRALERVPPARAGSDGAGTSLSPDVHRAVLALPLRQREVVVLHYLLDQDIATIARTAGISPGAVKNALFNARAALARQLQSPGPALDPPLHPTQESP